MTTKIDELQERLRTAKQTWLEWDDELARSRERARVAELARKEAAAEVDEARKALLEAVEAGPSGAPAMTTTGTEFSLEGLLANFEAELGRMDAQMAAGEDDRLVEERARLGRTRDFLAELLKRAREVE